MNVSLSLIYSFIESKQLVLISTLNLPLSIFLSRSYTSRRDPLPHYLALPPVVLLCCLLLLLLLQRLGSLIILERVKIVKEKVGILMVRTEVIDYLLLFIYFDSDSLVKFISFIPFNLLLYY